MDRWSKCCFFLSHPPCKTAVLGAYAVCRLYLQRSAKVRTNRPYRSACHEETMSGTVRKITVLSHPDTPYFLRLDWTGDLGAGFSLALSDGSTAWIGEVSEDDVASEASDMGVDREQYVDDLHQALVEGEERGRRGGVGGRGGCKPEKENYSFHLTPDHCRFSYEKTSKGILIQLGSVELQPALDPLELNRKLIVQTLEQGTALGSLNARLREENRTLRGEHRRLLRELEQHVQHKEAQDQELYSGFVAVLNEKKARLRGLRGRLRQLQRTARSQDRGGQSNPDDEEASVSRTEGDTSQMIRPSQQPTILITGRDLVCQGLPPDQSVSSDEEQGPRRKREPRPLQSQESSSDQDQD